MKRPAFMFYPADWLADASLSMCSAATQGTWIRILCLMHQCDERGVLRTNDRAWSKEDLASAVGHSSALESIDELCAKGVMKVREEDGAFYSSRMVRDDKLSRERAFVGKLGGQTSKQNPSKTEANTQAKPKQTPKQTPEYEYENEYEGVSVDENNEKQKKTGGCGGGSAPISPDQVQRIYDAYPRKMGHKAALAAIEKAISLLADREVQDPVEWLLARVNAYAESRRGQDPKFTPHPATWFNQERFNDEPEARRSARQNKLVERDGLDAAGVTIKRLN